MTRLFAVAAFCLIAVGGVADETSSATAKSDGADAAQPAPLFQLTIRPSTATKRIQSASSSVTAGAMVPGGGGGGFGVGGGGGGARGFVGAPPAGAFRQRYGSTTSGATLTQLISDIYHVSGPRLLVDFEPPEARYDVIVTSQGGTMTQIDPIRRQAIEVAFGLASQYEKHDLDAYILTVKDKEPKGLRPTQVANSARWQADVGKMSGVNVGFGEITKPLEPLLKQPIVDETGLKGKYDFELKWDQPDRENADPDAVIQALREQLGLEVTLAMRPIDILVVNQQKAPPLQRIQMNAAGN